MTRCHLQKGNFMAKEILSRLSQEKIKKIRSSLLKEFSEYNISEAQVARIVKEANISRGSFYTYFSDLFDAYNWILSQVLTEVHQRKAEGSLNSAELLILSAEDNEYFNFLRKYFEINESLLRVWNSKNHKSPDYNFVEHVLNEDETRKWVKDLITHEAIRQSFLHPEERENIVLHLKAAEKLIGEKEV
ncbi:hypothetical protein DQM10_10300 [Leuconostoc mesenteroides subsp. mesenteroides]|nr:TetR/AcrR family transcriptional regulator [Leuconostoc suionicum]RDF86642.1 hypothetical protein DQM10_10300 [Leuconostoc mesenteroides subsp. mesenteroides]